MAARPTGAGFVTGGSRGIGLEMARIMARRGQNLALFARDAAHLAATCDALAAEAPTDTVIRGYACDVANTDALQDAVRTAVADVGAPSHAIAAAGIAVPGLFVEQDTWLQDRHMDVNFRGSRDFVAAALPHMAPGGRIGLITSAAAYLAIYGYSAYTPSKYALRGLAEVLRLELAERGISVTHIAPPDTDTVQYATEQTTKPPATKEITAAGGLWRPEDVASRAMAAVDRGAAEASIGLQTKALARMAALCLPLLRGWQSRIIRRHDGG